MRRMHPGSVFIAFVLVLSSLGQAGVGLAQPAMKAYILDSGARSVTALELPTTRPVGTLSIEGHPEVMLRSPDGSRLIVLDRGQTIAEGSATELQDDPRVLDAYLGA